MKEKIKKILSEIERAKSKKREELQRLIRVGEQLLTLKEFQKLEIQKKIKDTIKKAKKDIKQSYK